jgi:protein transport protein DSL1/ZW10
MDLETTISAFEKLGILSSAIEKLCDDLDAAILVPLLACRTTRDEHPSVFVEGDDLQISDEMKSGVGSLFDDLTLIMKTMNQLLPSPIASPLCEKLMASVAATLTTTRLLTSLPVDIQGMEGFQGEVALVSRFADTIDSSGWPGKAELDAWKADIPRIWLAKRRESSLDDVRRLLSSPHQGTKQVERIEKQTVSSKEDVFAANAAGDDWDAGWEDDGGKPQGQTSSAETYDEDVSAWGLEDEDAGENKVDGPSHPDPSLADDDGGEAWGWDDEGDGEETESPTKLKAVQGAELHQENGMATKPESSEREYVLRETYHVTDVPDSLLELIVTQIRDSAILSQNG